MARKTASTKLTGGGGFAFEDYVAVYFAAHLLTGSQPFGADRGRVVRIDYQTRDRDWLCDDLLVSFQATKASSLALSIKSDRQVSSNGFPSEFVRDAWEQWIGFGSREFRKSRDRIGLGVGKLADSVSSAWNWLLTQARATTPDRFIKRLRTRGQSSKIARKLLDSLKCPADLTRETLTDEENQVQLLSRVEVIRFDFERSLSSDWAHVLALLQQALENGSAREAEEVSQSLLSLSSRLRSPGGTMTLSVLLAHLRPHFVLKVHPEYEADWKKLKARTEVTISRTKSSLVRNIKLDRKSLITSLTQGLQLKPFIILVGESGSGKSALAKEVLVTSELNGVWLSANSLHVANGADIGASFDLRYPLLEILTASPRPVLIVIDGLDRADTAVVAAIASLLTSLGTLKDTISIQVIITSETQGWFRAHRQMSVSLIRRVRFQSQMVTLKLEVEFFPIEIYCNR